MKLYVIYIKYVDELSFFLFRYSDIFILYVYFEVFEEIKVKSTVRLKMFYYNYYNSYVVKNYLKTTIFNPEKLRTTKDRLTGRAVTIKLFHKEFHE